MTSLKKVVATSISDQSKTSLRPKIRRFYDVFVPAGVVPIEIDTRTVFGKSK